MQIKSVIQKIKSWDIKSVIKKLQSRKLLKTFFLFLILLLPLVFLQALAQKIIFQKKATDASPSFSFSQTQITVNPGQEFIVEVIIDTAGQQSSGASVQITYNQDVFEAVEIIPGKDISQIPPMFPIILRKTFNNQTGKIYFDAGVNFVNPVFYVSRGIFGKIKFRVKSQASGSQQTIAFYLDTQASLGNTDIIGSGAKTGVDILGQVNNLTITVTTGPTVTPGPSPTSGLSPTPNPSPIPTTIPTLTPSPIPLSPSPIPTASECSQKGGVCCKGDFGCCQGRIGWGTGTTSEGCDPSSQGKFWCCQKCLCK